MRKSTWSAWNFIGSGNDSFEKVRVSYWMNKLQIFQQNGNFVTLNPQSELNEIHYQTHYTHPIFDVNANKIRIKSIEIQGKIIRGFCSACLGDGFHEDGLQAGLWVAKQIVNKLPLARNKNFNRLPKSYQKSY